MSLDERIRAAERAGDTARLAVERARAGICPHGRPTVDDEGRACWPCYQAELASLLRAHREAHPASRAPGLIRYVRGEVKVLTTREVADYCSVTSDTVRRWKRENRLLPVGRTPKTFLYDKADVDSFLRKQIQEESTVVRDQLNAILAKHRRAS